MDYDISSDYINLGSMLQFLAKSQGENVHVVLDRIKRVNKTLEKMDFDGTLAHIERLIVLGKNIEFDYENNEHKFNNGIPYDDVMSLSNAVGPIFTSLSKESQERHLARLFKDDTSDLLRNLSFSEDVLAVLHGDTIRCLECGANRAAIVMGWNLTYEFIRLWIFKDTTRLASFNAKLTSANITDYEDFFGIGERSVLDIAKKAGFLPKDKYNLLVEKLNKRHQFAHSTFLQATSKSASGYIEELILNVLDNSQFS